MSMVGASDWTQRTVEALALHSWRGPMRFWRGRHGKKKRQGESPFKDFKVPLASPVSSLFLC